MLYLFTWFKECVDPSIQEKPHTPVHVLVHQNPIMTPHLQKMTAFTSILCFILCFHIADHNVHVYAKLQPVFIATSTKSKSDKPVQTATDAAMALNSIQFMEMLVGTKNSADIKTYIQSVGLVSHRNYDMEPDTDTEKSILSWTDSFASVNFFSLFRPKVSSSDNKSVVKHSQSKSKWNISNSCVEHETVAEYNGRLWFLNKSGIKFRETIQVVGTSSDGKSSTVECITEYYNRNEWISCSKVICEFTSHSHNDENSTQKDEVGLKMTLDCQLLVWLPLPHIAKNEVRNKITSVFERVAIDFFKERAK